MNRQEALIYKLRSMYRSFGYMQYRMSRFEEYDLYARNKDFLISEDVITFTDTNGKLMALKPDVTLSIVRSSRVSPGSVEKVFYNENVYRVSKRSRSFKEIMQVGLECIGAVDEYCIAEVLTLAAMSLREISADSVLSISHLGVIASMLEELGLSFEGKAKVIKCIGEKNLHGIAAVCSEEGVDSALAAPLCSLVRNGGTADEILPVLESMKGQKAAAEELRQLVKSLCDAGVGDMIRLDFSVIGDISYYNGIVFRGFVSGVPSGVLSGGQYNRLMKKMGKKDGAIGFAVYVDQLERLLAEERGYDIDTVLLYSSEAEPAEVSAAVRALQAEGSSVAARKAVPEKLRYRRLIRLEGKEMTVLEDNA